GQVFVGAAVLLLLFVVYQLYGTGIAASRSQQALRHQLAVQKAPPSKTAAPTSEAPRASIVAPAAGAPLGIIYAPSINLDKAVVEGVGESDLERGPGHYPGTPLPGQAGNAAIAGHRTTWGAPFFRLNQLRTEAPIYLQTAHGDFTYRVLRSFVVSPTNVLVIAPTKANLLTLTTCTPAYSAAKRLVVRAALVGQPILDRVAPIGGSPSAGVQFRGAPPGSGPVTSPASHAALGVGGEGGSWVPAIGWGTALVGACALLWRLGGRLRRRRWLAYVASVPFCLVLVYLFFGGISAVLPASI
ncbi:MAG: class E sortase, partial [Acidimicrobiales bacterium]